MTQSATQRTPLNVLDLAAPPRRRNAAAVAARLAAAIVLAVVVAGVYRPAIDAPFIFDDSTTILGNPSIYQLWPLWDGAQRMAPLNPPKNLPTSARPLANLSFAIDYHFAGFNPREYHVVNIALHVLAALVLWSVVRCTLSLDYFAGRFDRVAGSLAYLAALAWALHPLNTETVVYTTQRTEELAGLCYLLTLLASLGYWGTCCQGSRAAWLTLAVLATFAGALSKEMIATVPAMVLLFERTFVAGSFRQALGKSWPLYLGIALALWPIVAINWHGPRTPLAGFDQGVPAEVWWMTQAKVLFLYLKLAVWPWPLVIHYDLPLIRSLADGWFWIVAAGVLLIATAVLLWRRSAVGFVAAWAVVVLSPTLVVPLVTEVATERRMYLPLAALVPLAVVAIYRASCYLAEHRPAAGRQALTRWTPLAATMACCLAVTAAYGVVSQRRVEVYQDELVLMHDAEQYYPHDSVIHVVEGILLQQRGEHDEAMRHLEQAAHDAPDSFSAHYNLARAYDEAGEPGKAIEHYQAAVRAKPDLAPAHNNLGLLLANLGKTDQAIEQFQLALASEPEMAATHANLGILLSGRGQVDEAIGHFEEAVRLRPSVESYANLAAGYSRANRPAEAIAAAEQAIAMARAEGQDQMARQLEGWLNDYRESVGQ